MSHGKVFEHKLPAIGTVLVHNTRPKGGKSEKQFAKVVPANNRSGIGILYEGKIYDSMSAAAVAAGNYSADGWLYWKEEQNKKG